MTEAEVLQLGDNLKAILEQKDRDHKVELNKVLARCERYDKAMCDVIQMMKDQELPQTASTLESLRQVISSY